MSSRVTGRITWRPPFTVPPVGLAHVQSTGKIYYIDLPVLNKDEQFCHQTRSVDTNLKRARETMRENREVTYKGEERDIMKNKKESIQRKQDKRKRAKENLEKKLFKEALLADSKPRDEKDA
ncbi:unnamed protein product [Coregonus sp. 'balchen']|nr:unnamed protein product [Coregonus sp. 'balchen']